MGALAKWNNAFAAESTSSGRRFEKHVPSCGFLVVSRAAVVVEASRAVMVDGIGGDRTARRG